MRVVDVVASIDNERLVVVVVSVLIMSILDQVRVGTVADVDEAFHVHEGVVIVIKVVSFMLDPSPVLRVVKMHSVDVLLVHVIVIVSVGEDEVFLGDVQVYIDFIVDDVDVDHLLV